MGGTAVWAFLLRWGIFWMFAQIRSKHGQPRILLGAMLFVLNTCSYIIECVIMTGPPYRE